MRHSFTRLALSLAVGVALIGSAMSVHAAGLTTDQVSAIISMLKSFGVEQTTITQVNQVLGGSSASSGSSSASSISCVDITRTLTIDSQGSDVTSLQAYLIAKGYLASGNATGFYGTQTAQAVGKLQVALGIISASDSGLGILGPKTRAAIACTPQTITETPAPTQTQIQTLTTPTQTALTTTIPFPVINSFTMTPVSTTGGSTSFTLDWSATNTKGCNVIYKSGNKYLQPLVRTSYPTNNSSDGVHTVSSSVQETTTFELLCAPMSGASTGIEAVSTVVVPVSGTPTSSTVPNPAIGNLTVSPDTVTTGGAASFAWYAVNTPACTIAPITGDMRAVTYSGTASAITPAITQTTTYKLTCPPLAGATGVAATRTVTVNYKAGTTVTPTPTPTPTVPNPVINSFTVSPQSVPKWSSATISWASTNTSSCTVTRQTGDNYNIDMTQATYNAGTGVYSVPTGKLGQTGTYLLTCVSPSGTTVTSTTGVTVVDPISTPTPTPTPTVPNPAITSLTATPATVIGGNISALAWSASNAASCTISPISGDMRAVSYTGATSATTPAITQSTTYQLTCTPLVGATGGAATRTVTVNYQALTPTPTPTPTPVPTQTTGPAPTITAFYASPVTVDPGNLSVLTWIAKNTSGCTVKATTASGSRFLDTASAFASPYSGVTYLTVNNIQQATTFELSCAPMAGSNASSAVATTKVTMF